MCNSADLRWQASLPEHNLRLGLENWSALVCFRRVDYSSCLNVVVPSAADRPLDRSLFVHDSTRYLDENVGFKRIAIEFRDVATLRWVSREK